MIKLSISFDKLPENETKEVTVPITFREAVHADIATLVQMLVDDALGATREDTSHPLNPRYLTAFAAIQYDPNNQLTVAEADGEIVGMLQLTFIPYLTHIGSWRCLIEGVRVHAAHRGRGIGRQLLHWAIDQAQAKQGCHISQYFCAVSINSIQL